MQLIGLEIENYAGLTAQYIPLTNRVHLIVGKNNAGKTALLHAIASSVWPTFRQYCEPSSVRFIYYLREDDGPNPPQFQFMIDHNDVPIKTDCIFKTTWSTPSQGIQPPELLEVDALPPNGHALQVIFAETNQRMMHRYQRRGNSTFPSGYTNHFTGETHILWSAVSKFNAFSYIDPHREIEHAVSAAEYSELPTDGANLAAFLLTMQGRNRKQFQKIEKTFLDCFPEYESLELPLKSSQVGIVLQERSTERKIPIAQCGTGVEQMLILISTILGAKDERIFLIDEPQDFLHPFLERRLMSIIEESHHRFLIATHSATLINSVPANQITFIERPGQSFTEFSIQKVKTGQVLNSLGYRNSDFLFYDGALFVEGSSDKELLPLLFKKIAPAEWQKMRDVCLCDLGGTREYSKFDDLVEDLIAQEKLIDALHRRGLPHMYLLDGDKRGEANRAANMRPADSPVSFDFLERSELENYLLDPEAIAAAINSERIGRNIEGQVTAEEVRLKLDELINVKKNTDKRLYEQLYKIEPRAGDKRIAVVQGSRVLTKLYEHFQLQYHKTRTGERIIKYLELSGESSAELSSTLERTIETLRPLRADATERGGN